MKKLFEWLASEESGQGMVEYGLILALVAVAVIAILGTMGGKLKDIFQAISNKLVVPPTTP